MTNISIQHWEEQCYVIVLNGKPIGQTLTKEQAELVKNWLITSFHDIEKVVKNKNESGIYLSET
jgi:hypothetical protein